MFDNVAIIMCVHPMAKFEDFEAALSSIRSQTYPSIRSFVYCDGLLPPGLDKVIENHISMGFQAKIYRSNFTAGLPTGLNFLIDSVLEDPSIQFILRMDSDDISTPDRVTRQVEFMRGNPGIHLCGAWCIEFIKPGEPIFYKKLPTDMREIVPFSTLRSPLVHPTVIFRRDVFEKGYRYRVDLKQMQDYDLWTRLLVDGYQISNIPDYLLWFRVANNFYLRRTGFRRAWIEVSMRLGYAKKINKISAIYFLKLLIFFLIRISPESIKRFSYKYLRT